MSENLEVTAVEIPSTDFIACGSLQDKANTYSKYYYSNYTASGSPVDYDFERIFKAPQENIKDIVGLCKYYYNKVGIIARVVNIVRDFGITDYRINDRENTSKKARKLVDNFVERIALKDVLRDVMFELAQTGNCGGYDRDGKRIDLYPVTKIEVSPLVVNNNPVLLFMNELSMQLEAYDEKILKRLEIAYPPEIYKMIKNNEEKAILDVDKTFFLKTNSSRYEPYGVPFILQAFDELAHKTVLKEAERATAVGIIDKILRVSVGDKDHTPKQKEIDFYHNMFDQKKGSLKVTVPYFVDVKWIEPDTSIFGAEKFEQVDQDILNALGISLTLIRGEGGGNYSEGFLSITGLIKTIENLRLGIPNLVNNWFKAELKRNGMNPDQAPVFTMEPVSIDASAKMDMIKFLFQSAGLPYEVLYKEAGLDYLNVKAIRESENEEDLDEKLFKPHVLPFSGNQQNDGKVQDDKGGAPTKNLTDRKSDKSKSNNDQPRAGGKKQVK